MKKKRTRLFIGLILLFIFAIYFSNNPINAQITADTKYNIKISAVSTDGTAYTLHVDVNGKNQNGYGNSNLEQFSIPKVDRGGSSFDIGTYSSEFFPTSIDIYRVEGSPLVLTAVYTVTVNGVVVLTTPSVTIKSGTNNRVSSHDIPVEKFPKIQSLQLSTNNIVVPTSGTKEVTAQAVDQYGVKFVNNKSFSYTANTTTGVTCSTANSVGTIKIASTVKNNTTITISVGDSSIGTATASITCTRDQFKLSISSSNTSMGTVSGSSGQIVWGDSCRVVATPNIGYKFDGWFEGSTKVSSEATYIFDMLTRDYTIVARFSVIEMTATFIIPTGASISSNSKTVSFNSTYGVLPTPSLSGYSFVAWHLDSLNGATVNSSTTVTKVTGHSLYAEFSANIYTIKYNLNSGVMAATEIKITYDSTNNALHVPTRVGYTFDGWFYGDTRLSHEDGIVVSAWKYDINNMNITAHWNFINYEITYDANNGTVNNQSALIPYDSAIGYQLEKPTLDGYIFTGWYKDGIRISDSDAKLIIIWKYNYSVNLIANYDAKIYTVNFDFDGGTLGGVTSYNVTFNSGYTLPVPTRTGYSFEGWLYNGDLMTNENGVSIGKWLYTTDNLVYTATWGALKYNVHFVATGENLTIPNDQKVEFGKPYPQFPVATRDGYDFIGWYLDVDCSINATGNVTTASNHNIYSKWIAKKYIITFDFMDGITLSQSIEVTYDQKISVSANPSLDNGLFPQPPVHQGLFFNGWYTMNNGNFIKQIQEDSIAKMTSNITVYAKYSFSVDVSAKNDITSVTYSESSIELTALYNTTLAVSGYLYNVKWQKQTVSGWVNTICTTNTLSIANVNESGTYRVVVSAVKDNNIIVVDSQSILIEVLKKEIVVDWISEDYFYYNGLDQSNNVYANYTLNQNIEELTIIFSGKSSIFKNAGNYHLTASFKTEDLNSLNYKLVNNEINISILKINQEILYNGKSINNYIEGIEKKVTYNALCQGFLNSEFELTDNSGRIVFDNNDQKDAGTYIVVLNVLSTENYNEYILPMTLIIEKAEIEGIEFNNETIVYNKQLHSIYLSSYRTSLGDSIVDVLYTGNNVINANTYTVTAILTHKNYNILVLIAQLEITKADVEITLSNQESIYGEKINISQVAYNVTVGAILSSDSLNILIYRNGSSNLVGEYELDMDYNNSNYNITYVKAKYIITPKDVKIALKSQSSNWGEQIIVNQTAYEIISGGILIGDDLNIVITKEAGSSQGYYELNATFNNSCYEVEWILNTYQIIEIANYTIILENQTFIYGDEIRINQSKYNSLMNIDSNILSELNIEIIFKNSNDESLIKNCGTYKITGIYLHESIRVEFIDALLTVIPRDIEISADNQSSVYKDSDYEFNNQLYLVTNGNFILDDENDFELICNYQELVGNYDINYYFNNNNYNVTFVKGLYTILKREIEVIIDDKDSIYGNSLEELTYQITAGTLMDDDSLNLYLIKESGNDAKDYIINYECYNKNYDVRVTLGTYTILKRNIEVIYTFNTKYEDGNIHNVNYRFINNLINDTLGDEITYSSIVKDAKDYVATVTITNNNYEIINPIFEFTIYQKTIKVSLDSNIDTDEIMLENNELSNDTLVKIVKNDSFEIIENKLNDTQENKQSIIQLYDITLIENDIEIQPQNGLKLRILLDEKNRNYNNINVIHIHDDEIEKVLSYRDGNYIVVLVDSFSSYALVIDKEASPIPPIVIPEDINTNNPLLIPLIITSFIAFCSLVFIIFFRRKNHMQLSNDNDVNSFNVNIMEIKQNNEVADTNEVTKEEIEDYKTSPILLSNNEIEVRFNKSFEARLILSTDEVKNRYSIVKNYLLSHRKVKNRISWNYETFFIGKKQLVKLRIKGKTLVMYIALNPNSLFETKYKGLDASIYNKYTIVPFMYKLNGERKTSYALDLIDMLGLEKITNLDVNYMSIYKNDTFQNLIDRKLIKVIGSDIEDVSNLKSKSFAIINDKKADDLLSDKVAIEKIEFRNAIIDTTYKVTINIDTLNDSFNDGDIINLDILKSMKLINKNATYFKVLARGSLSKKLIVEANDFSLVAVKMLDLMGGKAIKLK